VQIAATMTLEVIGLVLGTAFRCAYAGSSCTNLVMSVDKPSMRSSSRRQPQARSWMMRIMRSDSRSEHWARMPCNSVYRARPAQPKGTNWPKASKAKHYRRITPCTSVREPPRRHAVLSTLFAKQERHTQDKKIKTTKSTELAPRALVRQISCLAEGIFLALSG
jgi:hypothetical protein